MNSTISSTMTCDDCRQSTTGTCWRHTTTHIWPSTVRYHFDTAPQTVGTLVTPEHLCPDLLRYEQIGAADGLRGRLVRGVFFLLRAWPPRR